MDGIYSKHANDFAEFVMLGLYQNPQALAEVRGLIERREYSSIPDAENLKEYTDIIYDQFINMVMLCVEDDDDAHRRISSLNEIKSNAHNDVEIHPSQAVEQDISVNDYYRQFQVTQS